MIQIESYLNILECPLCHKGDLLKKNTDILKCNNCSHEYNIIEGIPDLVVNNSDLHFHEKKSKSQISFTKWHEYYNSINKSEDEYGFGIYLKDTLNTLNELQILNKIKEKDLILEIGSGRSYVSYGLAKLNKNVVCIDFILEPLLFAKTLFEKEDINGIFIKADMFNLPFKKEYFKFIYSFGVIEHHTDVSKAVLEMYRILKRGGYIYNTVPTLSLSSLTYGQLYGGIPNIPIIKDLFFFIHHKLLKGKHCKFGFELNYLEFQLKKIFKQNNFSNLQTGVWKITRPINFISNKKLKRVAQKLITYRLFAHMVYIYAEKK